MNDRRAGRSAGFVDRLVPLVAGMACLAALPPAIIVFVDAWRTQEIVSVLEDPSRLARGDMLDRYFDTSPQTLSPTAAAALAELAIEAADDGERKGLRKLYLGQARRLVRRVHGARPDWAIGDVLAARLQVAQNGMITPAAVRAFIASYRNGRFLRREAKWRIAFATLCWPSLDRRTQNAVVDEAVWMVRFDGDQRPAMERLLGDSPAGLSFQLKLARPSSL